MQVKSTKARVRGSLTVKAGHVEISKAPIAAITRRDDRDKEIPQPRTSPVLEGKLERIREVQHAFTLALRVSQSMESKYLFDPIF